MILIMQTHISTMILPCRLWRSALSSAPYRIPAKRRSTPLVMRCSPPPQSSGSGSGKAGSCLFERLWLTKNGQTCMRRACRNTANHDRTILTVQPSWRAIRPYVLSFRCTHFHSLTCYRLIFDESVIPSIYGRLLQAYAFQARNLSGSFLPFP